MLYDALISELNTQFSLESISSAAHTFHLRDVMLLEADAQLFQDDVLYCGVSSQLDHQKQWPIHCILALDGPKTSGRSGHNIALVEEQALFSVFNRARNIVEASRPGLYDTLVAKADALHDLDKVLNEASIMQGCSMVLLDNKFSIISLSKTIPVTDIAWENTMKRGYCNYEMVEEIKALESVQRLQLGTDIVEVISPKTPNRHIAANIMLDNRRIGYFVMITDEKPLDASHFLVVENIVRAISYTIGKYARFLFSDWGRYEPVLHQLLIEAQPWEIQDELACLTFPPHMAALCIRPAHMRSQKDLKEVIGSDLQHGLRGVQFTYHNDEIAAMISLEQGIALPVETTCALTAFAEKHQVYIGVSYAFFDIHEFPVFYRQAQEAIRLSHHLNGPSPFADYRDIQPYVFFTWAAESTALRPLCHPLPRLLHRIDSENGTELYRTLKVYIENGCSIKETAQLLYVHRNTLVSRLERIKELGNMEINTPDMVLLLRISFGIDRYIETK